MPVLDLRDIVARPTTRPGYYHGIVNDKVVHRAGSHVTRDFADRILTYHIGRRLKI